MGVALERSLELIIGILAILKAGGAYVPLDWSYPKERLRYMLEDTQASMVITTTNLLTALPEQTEEQPPYLCLDVLPAIFSEESTENLPTIATSENLAYCDLYLRDYG